MTRQELDHVLRAAGDLTGHRRFVLVGSTAIFAWHESVPAIMALSREADLYAFDVPDEEAERISEELENIGQLSTFDETHGYYVDGVGPHTAVLPDDWRRRSKIYASPAASGVVAIVPHPEDIALSKLCAGREKDVDWVGAAHASGLIDLDAVGARVDRLPQRTPEERQRILDLVVVAQTATRAALAEPSLLHDDGPAEVLAGFSSTSFPASLGATLGS